ncbi:MAG: SufD family Fe-S cluster assembly protein [Patescibacteria group bacterium]|nr:SufD family Fe-S cluster assembly protein [Patescibacteria group bacterium]
MIIAKEEPEVIHLKKNQDYYLVFDKEGKSYVVWFENFSGRLVVDLKASEVEVNIYGLYLGKNQSVFQVQTIQHHRAPNSRSNLLIKGVFYDQARFVYDGLIRIEKQAQKSHAYQKNQNLVLSSQAKVESNPNLEILANDVFCTHGSTTGFLNEEEIFYLMTRGLSLNKAKQLLVDGFIEEVRQKIDQIVNQKP